MDSNSFWKRNVLHLIFLAVTLIASVALFALEILSVERSPLNDALFGGLEFLLALATGLLLQRIASREEFLRSLRQYAISAYRRITDIKKSTARLQAHMEQM